MQYIKSTNMLLNNKITFNLISDDKLYSNLFQYNSTTMKYEYNCYIVNIIKTYNNNILLQNVYIDKVYTPLLYSLNNFYDINKSLDYKLLVDKYYNYGYYFINFKIL